MTTAERVKIKRQAARWRTLVDIAEAGTAVFFLLLLCGWL